MAIENKVWSITKTPLEQKVLDLCAKYVEPQGFRTVDVDCVVSGRSLIRVFIEKGSMPGTGTTLDDCVLMSELLSPALDVADLIPGAYDLEVSSPGIERRLRTVKDFEQVVGETIKMKFITPVEGLGRATRGKLLLVKGEKLLVSTDGREVDFPISQVKKAQLIWEPKESSQTTKKRKKKGKG